MLNDKEIRRIIEEEEEGMTLDYKEELTIATVSGKAGFVKDIVSLANNGQTAHIIIGVEDGTRKLVGIKSSYKLETLNQILMDKTDPPLRIEYKEERIMGCLVGVIEIDGSNAPYIISVHDKYGGIVRGTVFVRNMNMNEGARRADLDRIYERMKPIILESDVHLSTEVSAEPSDDFVEVKIKFYFINNGDALATDTYVYIQFENIKKIVKCNGGWRDISSANEGRPTISQTKSIPVVKGIRLSGGSVVVHVEKEIKDILTDTTIAASNMRTRTGEFVIQIHND